MKLRQGIDSIQFFKAVQACKGEVHFCSKQGDILNLKSTLSQYLFTFLLVRKDFLESGQITCNQTQDQICLKDFLMEDDENE